MTALQANPGIAAIVLDLGTDTIAILDHLAGLDDGSRPQVIALAGGSDALHRGRLLRRGADDAIGVPFGYSQLRYRLHARLARGALVDRLS